MEQYRKNLKIQCWISGIVAVAAIVVVILGFNRSFTPSYQGERWVDFWSGMYSGMATGIALLSIIGIIKNLLALRNEAKLKRQYVKENDERTQAIWEKVGGQSYWPIVGGLMLAIVISGYFSPVVCLTCLGCTMYICLVRLGLKLYYSKKI